MHQALDLSDADFEKLCVIVHKNTGITIGHGRKSMILSRLRRRLREIGDSDFETYISRVKKDPDEMQELINRVTTNKTYFYRTPRIWTHFLESVVPAFRAKKSARAMRLWSAASSTGEEAHTLGVLLEEIRLETGMDYTILGTDISSEVIEAAEEGLYRPQKLDPFRQEHPELVGKHMSGDDEAGYGVVAVIKSRLKFKLHNLQKRYTGPADFDAVFLRNVLIYFTNEDQEKILDHIAASMAPDGTLYIGESESLTRLETRFELIEPMVYRLTNERKLGQ